MSKNVKSVNYWVICKVLRKTVSYYTGNENITREECIPDSTYENPHYARIYTPIFEEIIGKAKRSPTPANSAIINNLVIALKTNLSK